uniref:Dipeptidylpeptidase IV N-terminal domain-containing protein n=1 Tax=Physcomitrium patens TaxID=3218 RepID=A0A7I4EGE6_PHYPA
MSLLGYQVTDVSTAEPEFAKRASETKTSALKAGKSERFSFLGWCGMLGVSLSPQSIRGNPEGSNFSTGSLSPPPRQTTMPTTDSQSLGDEYTLFPVEDIVQNPLPGYVAPGSVQFSPDDKLITYLYSPDSTLSRKIYAFDVVAKQQRLLVNPPGGGVDEGNLSTVEKLRRERLRERGLGVTRYEWAKGVPHRLMVPLPSGIYVQGVGSELRLRVASTPSNPILDPQLSPDASSIAYVRDDELFVVPLAFGEPIQITYGARGTGKTHGLAEYIAQEEMDRRNGFWWSPDSRYIAFAEVDSSRIPPFTIVHQGKVTTGGEAEEVHAYPFAGHSNVSVRLGVVPSNGDSVVWMDLEVGLCGEGHEDEEYLARVTWLPNGYLTAQVQNRTQSKLKLLRFDPLTGKRLVLLTEESEVWVNLHDSFTPLRKYHGPLSGGFIWASEKTGFRHLYMHDEFGNCIRALTQGSWMVEQVAGVDEDAGLVYFTGAFDSPLEVHLYSASLDCTEPNLAEPKRLTQGAGRHIVVLDHEMKKFVDIHDSLDTPPRLLLRSLDTGKLLISIYEQPAPTYHARRLQLTPPEFKSLTASDGTVLHGLIYIPDSKQFGRPPYRTVVSVYGGPNVQIVCNSWMNTVDMRAQYLRSRGILVWKR